PNLPRELWGRKKSGFFVPVLNAIDSDSVSFSRGRQSRVLAARALQAPGVELAWPVAGENGRGEWASCQSHTAPPEPAANLAAGATPSAVAADPAPATRFSTPLQRRLRSWIGILSAYFGTQTVTQLLGIAAGLLFIRNMPVPQFALYTLSTS